MDRLSGRSFRMWLERALGLVVVLVMAGAAGSSALAAGSPGDAGNSQTLSPSYITQCEAQLAQAAPQRQQAMAPYAGLAALRSDRGRFDLWRPAGWSVSIVDAAAVILNADRESRGAHFSIQVMDTPDAATVDDLLGRIEWFNKLVYALPNTQVQRQSRWTEGNVTGFEARYTFRDDGADTTTSRWVRVLFVGAEQYYLVAEAPSTAAFDSLEPTFLAMMLTFRPDDRIDPMAPDMCTA